MARVIEGRPLVASEASGRILISDEPLSFWGGYDPGTGEIIDRRHPLTGVKASGRVLALPGSRGSSTTTAVLLEAIRADCAPAAIIVKQPEHFFSLAAVVADELYGKTIPIIQITAAEFSQMESGLMASISSEGKVHIEEGDT
ncbi:MAG: aconitase X swivel domain-containing protein [Anaerolineales bacterium]